MSVTTPRGGGGGGGGGGCNFSESNEVYLVSISHRLGSDVFQKLYENLKEARRRRDAEHGVTEDALNCAEDEADVSFQVDQLLFYEEELQRLRQLQEDRASV